MKKREGLKKLVCFVMAFWVLIGTLPIGSFVVKPMETSAATFDDVNQSSVFLKQPKGSVICTLVSATMLLRRAAILSGDANWGSITADSVKPSAWIEGTGLRWSFYYNGMHVTHGSDLGGSESKLIGMLQNHPEGIVIYDTSKPHAILVTDYTNGVFYCADPNPYNPSGRIPISQASITIGNSTAYWYIDSPKLNPAQQTEITDIQVINKDATGYTVQFKINNYVNHVQCPTWTEANGQDDIQYEWWSNPSARATHIGDGVYQYRVNVSDHNNEYGLYCTHIYAYDDAGNWVSAMVNDIDVPASDTEAPVISDVVVLEQDSSGYLFQCKVTDNKKVNRVQCPNWTLANGQDDLQAEWWVSPYVTMVDCGDGIYQYRVNISEHNNEYGVYRTHIYAYDDVGNSSKAVLPDITIPDVPVVKEDGYSYCQVLPSYVTEDQYIIEYNNHLETVQQNSPGADWTQEEIVKSEWQNSGEQYTSETDLPTSDSRVLVRSVYYHFCGPNAGSSSHYTISGNFVHYDEIDTGKYGVTPSYQGTVDGHPYYFLDWNDGGGRVYCKSGVTCDGSYGTHGVRSCAWFKTNTYQDRVRVDQYRYTKNSGWVDQEDPSAATVEFRFKEKESQAPMQDTDLPAQSDHVYGDADGNGTVDLDDALVVLKVALKISVLDDITVEFLVDVDEDGNVTLDDAQITLKMALKIIPVKYLPW